MNQEKLRKHAIQCFKRATYYTYFLCGLCGGMRVWSHTISIHACNVCVDQFCTERKYAPLFNQFTQNTLDVFTRGLVAVNWSSAGKSFLDLMRSNFIVKSHFRKKIKLSDFFQYYISSAVTIVLILFYLMKLGEIVVSN